MWQTVLIQPLWIYMSTPLFFDFAYVLRMIRKSSRNAMQAVHAQFLRYVTVWGDIHPHCHIPLYSISVGYKSFFIKGIYLLYVCVQLLNAVKET